MGRVRVNSYERQGLRFDVTDRGPLDGEPVVLLHGWPGGAGTWNEVTPMLVAQGFRVLAPNQRGYSPDARPEGARPYAMTELVADAVALLDAAGLGQVHLVGHDWGGAVAWTMAEQAPERLASLTVLATPHPRAMQRAMLTSTQALRSWYMLAFQIPRLPERLLLAHDGRRLRRALEQTGLDIDRAATYVEGLRPPGALTASLAWYRALRFTRPRPSTGRATVRVPTTFAWGSADAALGRAAAEATRRYVAGPYRFEELRGASHWLPEQHAERVAGIIGHAATAHPIEGSPAS